MDIIEARQRFNLVGVSPALWSALTTRGKEYKGIARPKGYRKWRDGDCFRNASMIATRSPNDTYVEGVAYDLHCLFHHAWVTTDDEHAIDITWPEPGVFYWGIAVPLNDLCDVLSRTGEYGCIIEGLENREAA